MSARPQSWKKYIKYDQETVASKCMNKLIYYVTFNLLPMYERNSVIGKRMKFNVQDFFSKHEQNSVFVQAFLQTTLL